MDLLEYQGKQYMARWGVAMSPGGVATTVAEALVMGAEMGWPVAVKAQVPVGGRGKAGGVKLASGPEELGLHAEAILGMSIGGQLVRLVWIEQAADIAAEHYVGVTLDRATKDHLVMVSARGGVDIEEVVAEDPAAVARAHVDPLAGLSLDAARLVVAEAGLAQGCREAAAELVVKLYRCFVEGDAELVEVNPLIVTSGGAVQALDAKISLDDNAGFRHPEWSEFRAVLDAGLDKRERRARAKGLNYIGLDGTVGIIANGAGLAMATLDVVNEAGGEGANFLDIGGGANAAVMAAALELINSDPKVASILVNIFGGITRCEEVANGIIEALGQLQGGAPIVLRLDGTNAEAGRAILARHSSERLVVRPTMLEAARTAVELAGRAGAGGPGQAGAGGAATR